MKKMYFILVFILKTIQGALSVGIIYFFSYAIDEFTKAPSQEKFSLILVYSLLELGFVFAHHLCQRAIFSICKKYTLFNSTSTMDSIFKTPPELFLKKGSDYYLTAFKDQIPKIERDYFLGKINILSTCIQIVLTVYVLAYFHFSLPILLFTSFIIGRLITKLIEPKIDKISSEEIKVQEYYNGKTSENQKGLPFYIINQKRKLLFERQCQANSNFENKVYKIELHKTLFEWVIALSSMFLTTITLSFAIFLFAKNKITVGMLASTILYLNTFAQKLEYLLNLFVKLRFGKVSKNKIDDIKNIEIEKNILNDGNSDFNNFQSLKLENISFTYPNSKNDEKDEEVDNIKNNLPILKNINLEIKKGDKILLKGKSGSGKSTLIKIILNMIEPDTGSLYLNEKKIEKNNYTPFYFINQGFHVFKTSIEDNIFFGNRKEKMPYDFARLRKFYDEDVTAVGSDGVELSGGEKERLALARVFAGSYKNVIMDETFSGLDFENYKFIQDKFLNDKDMTYIEISHREIDTSKFDYIWNLDGGEINVTTFS